VTARGRAAARRGRPQSEAATAALMRATLAVVAARGYHAATLEEIVARAGSSKPTVYRRWPSKPRLVADAVRFALAAANPSAPATGRPLADVRAVVGNVIHALRTTPLARVLAALVGAAADEPALAEALVEVERERRRVLRAVVERAGARDADLDVDLVLGALYFRVLMRRMPVDARLVARLTRRLYGRSCDGS
jgi:AcrR family transcriptional regulator